MINTKETNVPALMDGDGIYRVEYWRQENDFLTSATHQNATLVRVICGSRSHFNTDIEYEWPRERYEASRLCHMLHNAHQKGRQYAKAEIRAVLGV